MGVLLAAAISLPLAVLLSRLCLEGVMRAIAAGADPSKTGQ